MERAWSAHDQRDNSGGAGRCDLNAEVATHLGHGDLCSQAQAQTSRHALLRHAQSIQGEKGGTCRLEGQIAGCKENREEHQKADAEEVPEQLEGDQRPGACKRLGR